MNLVFLTALISGLSIWLNKFGVEGINPYFFTTMKNVLVALILSMIVLRNRKVKRKDLPRLALVGLVGGSVPFLLFFKGLQLTSAVSASFIHKMMFVPVGILSYLFLKEGMEKRNIISMILLTIGLVLYTRIDFFAWNTGDLLVLGATILWGAEIVLSKRLMEDLDGSVVAWGRMFFGSLFLLVFLFGTGNFESVGTMEWGWIGVTSLLLFGYVSTFYNGMKKIRAAEASSILLFGVVVTSLLSGNVNFGLLLITLGVSILPAKKVLNKIFKRVVL